MVHYVIDTSVVIKAYFNDDLRADLLLTTVNLIAPSKIEIELANKTAKIQLKTRMSSSKFDAIWQQLKKKIVIKNVDKSKLNQAERILRDLKHLKLGVGLEDKHFFALALYLRCPYWTFEEKYWGNPSVSNALRARGIKVVPSINL